MTLIGLDNPHTEYIDGAAIASLYDDSKYHYLDDRMETHAYQLTIKEDGEPDDSPECFPVPCSAGSLSLRVNRNYSSDDLIIVNALFDGSFFEDYSYDIAYTAIYIESQLLGGGGAQPLDGSDGESAGHGLGVAFGLSPFLIGEVIDATGDEQLPDELEEYVLLLSTDDPAYQNKINNLIDASGFIIMTDLSEEDLNYNKSVPAVIISIDEGNDILSLLDNYRVLAYAKSDGDTLSIVYHFGETVNDVLGSGFDGSYMMLESIPTLWELRNLPWFVLSGLTSIDAWWFWLTIKTHIWRILWPTGCRGGIIYDYNDDTYFMYPALRNWYTKTPNIAVPVLSVTGSVGQRLQEDANRLFWWNKQLRLDYYLDQTYTENVLGYNVVGTCPRAKDESTTAVIGNHYDSWWGQCSGDSGAGEAIMLGIAKYIEDHELTPKYNLRFVGFSGEEYGDRGSFFHSLLNRDENIKYMICLDQMAFDQSEPIPASQEIFCHEDLLGVVSEIVHQNGYVDRTGYIAPIISGDAPSDDIPFFKRGRVDDNDPDNPLTDSPPCETVCISKDYNWTNYHRSSPGHQSGDVIGGIDRNDLNVSAELAWDFTKYFLFDPDCWFENVDYEAVDSPDDGIKATFSIRTCLPYDKVMVKAYLKRQPFGVTWASETANFTITNELQNEITVYVPDIAPSGNYYLHLELYNSTGKINDIIGVGDDNVNDTDTSDPFYLEPFLELIHIDLQDGWNLISIPVGESVDKTSIIVRYDNYNYTWDEAVSGHIIVECIFGWENNMYTLEDILEPGEGYWMYAYYDCELLLPSNVQADDNITILQPGWNFMGIPYDTTSGKYDVRIHYDESYHTWNEAVAVSVIINFVYGWDGANQRYMLADTLVPGCGYWVYAYHGCALKKS